jgi:hypothetical protein
VWCEPVDIMATPTEGAEFGDQPLQMVVDGNIVMAGFGHKLKDKVLQVRWTDKLVDNRIYGLSLEYGPVRIAAPSLKSLEALFGAAFVRIDSGIIVARRAVLVPNIAQRMAGVCVGTHNGHRVVNWVVMSKRGAKRLEEALPHFERPAHTPSPDAIA